MQVCEAAWRWRFGRRWVQEQAKQFDPEQADDAEEEWDDALGYLDACGPGFNLIARTSSEFAEPYLNRTQSLLSQDSGVSKSLNSLLMDDYSLKEVLLHSPIGTLGLYKFWLPMFCFHVVRLHFQVVQ